MEKIKIYISAGWFDNFQNEALTFIENLLFEQKNFEIYSPRKEIKLNGIEDEETQELVFRENLKNIENSDLVISSTVGKDMGTLFEDGYAYAKNIPIIYTFFDERFDNIKFNLMLARSGISCYINKKDFSNIILKLNNEGIKVLNNIKKYTGDFE